jgi:hypothetical protein
MDALERDDSNDDAGVEASVPLAASTGVDTSVHLRPWYELAYYAVGDRG